MISIELSPEIEKRFTDIVYESFDGDLQKAITTLMELHQKYGWKDQLRQDVKSVRAEVTRQGGINAKTVDNAIKRYRKSIAGD